MSLIPFLYSDPIVDLVRPSRLFNQQFGLHLDPEDFLTPTVLSPVPQITRCPFLYYRPWTSAAATKDAGSTVKFDKDKFEVDLDVAQFKPEEVTVKLTGDREITVEGKHEEKEDEHGYISRRFTRRYILPKGVDVEKVASSLSSDGVLKITAPRVDEKKAIESERKVEVKQTGEPAKIENKKAEKKEETKEEPKK
uniref:Small heat shock protein 22.2 n=1 Tax=Lasioderma serricorne TaxID=295660 RepID=A0A5B8NHU9_9COLE|nr:small heat shock protein 22.2 [Lasioderma serricorne]